MSNDKSKVVQFPGLTTLDLDPDEILKAAIGNVKQVVICAVDNDDMIYFTSNTSDLAEVNYLIDKCKYRLVKGE